MGLISRVSSRTYRVSLSRTHSPASLTIKMAMQQIQDLDWANAATVPLYSLAFYAFNKLLAPRFMPESVPERKRRTWNNIFTSLIHSSITAVGSLLALYETPALATDLF